MRDRSHEHLLDPKRDGPHLGVILHNWQLLLPMECQAILDI